MQTVKLADFLKEYQEEIAASVIRDYPPIYQFSKRDKYALDINKLRRKPYLAQFDTIAALAELFLMEDSGVVVGEMGSGKTICAIGLAYVMRFKSVLVMCPPHLVKKWEREIKITLPVDSVRCHHFKKFTDVDRAVAAAGNDNLFHFFIVGRERAKLSYQWRPAYNWKKSLTAGESRKIVKWIRCPRCGDSILDSEGIPVDPDEMGKKKAICDRCGEFLWQAKATGPRRYSIAEYIKRKHKGFFDLLVVDEAHEYKGRGSAQGLAAGILASSCKKSLAMTGTLFGGYSSTLFHLLYRLTSTFKDDYGHSQVSKWIDHYGIWERVSKYDDSSAYGSDNVQSRGRKYKSSPREKPGISPVILPKYLLDKTVFIRLSDIAVDLPSLQEEIVGFEMSDEQAVAYDALYEKLRAALLEALQHGDKSLLAVYLQALLTYPDRCTVEELVYDQNEQLIAVAPALDSSVLYPKEQAIIDLIKKERASGRKVLVFCTHTNRRDVTARLQEKIQAAGIRSEILKATVAADKREAWIQEHANSLDCLITNPALVQTGLDLIEFPTVAYLQSGYSVYTLRQSSRRSWRIGQDKPVKIYYFVYTGTMQEQALKLLASKMKASLILEGDLGEDGLATYNVGNDNLFYELARNIANNVSVEESLDVIWKDGQEKEKERAGSDLLIESLGDYENKPDLNGALKRPVSEIKRKYGSDIWDKLYRIRMQEKKKSQDKARKRREKKMKSLPADSPIQASLFG